MRILLTGDSHSNWKVLERMVREEEPDMFISCGDWGTHMDDRIKFEQFIKNLPIPVITIYGNHDDITQIKEFKAPNYHWLPNFKPIIIRGFKFIGINGNVAGKLRHPWHITEKIIREELRLSSLKKGMIDFIVSHECPKGYADILRSWDRDESGNYKWKKSVGFESLFEVMQKIKPKFWQCGHLHYQQIAQWEKTIIFNSGSGTSGDYVLLDTKKEYLAHEWINTLRRIKNGKNNKKKEEILP